MNKSVSSLFFEYSGARLYQYFFTQPSRFLRPLTLFLSCPSAKLRLSVPSFVRCGCFIYTTRGVRERVYVQGQIDVMIHIVCDAAVVSVLVGLFMFLGIGIR